MSGTARSSSSLLVFLVPPRRGRVGSRCRGAGAGELAHEAAPAPARARAKARKPARGGTPAAGDGGDDSTSDDSSDDDDDDDDEEDDDPLAGLEVDDEEEDDGTTTYDAKCIHAQKGIRGKTFMYYSTMWSGRDIQMSGRGSQPCTWRVQRRSRPGKMAAERRGRQRSRRELSGSISKRAMCAEDSASAWRGTCIRNGDVMK